MTYVVMVQCPNKDKAVPTGTVCDLRTFCHLTQPTQFHCTACGEAHHWVAYDAWLRDPVFATGQLVLGAETPVSAASAGVRTVG
jgi:hypothetical protein